LAEASRLVIAAWKQKVAREQRWARSSATATRLWLVTARG
jgi:hypothetical protein